jgi:hypothetical protein
MITLANAKSRFAFSLLFVALTCITASAQILYDNGSGALGSPNGVGVYADTGSSYVMEGNIITPTESGTAFSITFAGIYYGPNGNGTDVSLPATDAFVISLYSAPGGVPDTTDAPITSVVSNVTRTLLGAGNSQPVYQFTGTLNTPLTLAANSSYVLGISDTTNSYEDFAVDLTNNTSGGTVNIAKLANGSFQTYSDTPLAFSLDVPEPSEWALMVLGAAGLFAAVRRRRSA